MADANAAAQSFSRHLFVASWQKTPAARPARADAESPREPVWPSWCAAQACVQAAFASASCRWCTCRSTERTHVSGMKKSATDGKRTSHRMPVSFTSLRSGLRPFSSANASLQSCRCIARVTRCAHGSQLMAHAPPGRHAARGRASSRLGTGSAAACSSSAKARAPAAAARWRATQRQRGPSRRRRLQQRQQPFSAVQQVRTCEGVRVAPRQTHRALNLPQSLRKQELCRARRKSCVCRGALFCLYQAVCVGSLRARGLSATRAAAPVAPRAHPLPLRLGANLAQVGHVLLLQLLLRLVFVVRAGRCAYSAASGRLLSARAAPAGSARVRAAARARTARGALPRGQARASTQCLARCACCLRLPLRSAAAAAPEWRLTPQVGPCRPAQARVAEQHDQHSAHSARVRQTRAAPSARHCDADAQAEACSARR